MPLTSYDVYVREMQCSLNHFVDGQRSSCSKSPCSVPIGLFLLVKHETCAHHLDNWKWSKPVRFFPISVLEHGLHIFFQQQCLVRLPSATDNEIRSAYRRRALSTHPDKGGSAEAFRSVVSAFETLTLDIPWWQGLPHSGCIISFKRKWSKPAEEIMDYHGLSHGRFQGSIVRKLPSYGWWSWLAFTP